MSLPKLLRRLRQAAESQSTRDAGEILAELGRNSGWDGDVLAFAKRLRTRDQAFLSAFMPGLVDAIEDVIAPGATITSGAPPPARPLVPTDPLSGFGVPLTLANWSLVTSKVPASTWGFQDAAAPIVKTVGTDLTVTGTLDYQQAVGGGGIWTRTATRFTETANERAAWAAAVGGNPSTTSVAWFGYFDFTTPGVNNRRFLTISDGATSAFLDMTTTPRIRLVVAGVAVSGSADPSSGVHPVLLVYDRTNSTVKCYTDQEIITGTYNSGVVDGNKGFGGSGSTTCPMDVLLGAEFEGANAEFSDSQVRSMFVANGWSIPW